MSNEMSKIFQILLPLIFLNEIAGNDWEGKKEREGGEGKFL